MNQKIPKHIAIIPNGNRRWARGKGLREVAGHAKSTESEKVMSLLDEAGRIGIKYITFWGFSTENWRRSEVEKKFLFSLIKKLTKKLTPYAHKNKIGFRHIGRKDRLPKDVVLILDNFEKETKDYNALNVQFCLDYGGRDEILRAINKLLKEKKDFVDDKKFPDYLDTKGMPDPDMIIRTGGEKRTSGFMPFQSEYAELYFTNIYFPDFGPAELHQAVKEFSERQRRYGGD